MAVEVVVREWVETRYLVKDVTISEVDADGFGGLDRVQAALDAGNWSQLGGRHTTKVEIVSIEPARRRRNGARR